jgi:hypothetical protein
VYLCMYVCMYVCKFHGSPAAHQLSYSYYEITNANDSYNKVKTYIFNVEIY